MGVCNCSMFCCTLLYVHSSIAIILMGKRELIALLNLSSWCLVMVERLFFTLPRGCLQFVIVVFPDHTHLLFLMFLIYCTSVCICYHVAAFAIPFDMQDDNVLKKFNFNLLTPRALGGLWGKYLLPCGCNCDSI